MTTSVQCDCLGDKRKDWQNYSACVTLCTTVLRDYLTLDLSSSRVKDTLGHTSTTAFSVDSELLRYFPGHADAFQILLYGVSIQFFRGLPGFLFELLMYSLSWQSIVVHSQNVPQPSQSSLFYDKTYLLQLCLCPALSLLTVFP